MPFNIRLIWSSFSIQDEAKEKYIELVDELAGPAAADAGGAGAQAEVVEHPGFHVSVTGKLRTIKLDKPDKKNAISLDMYISFGQLLKDAAADPNTTIVALTGSGNFLSSGNDLSNLTNFTGSVEEAANRGGDILL